MAPYIWISLLGALALSLSSVLSKMMIRYRICSTGLITWGQGLTIALVAGGFCLLLRIPPPRDALVWLPVLASLIILATYTLNRALQEGDASTVIPLLGLKIPLTALLASALLGEVVTARTMAAVVCSASALACFGTGSQRRAEGGHGFNPGVAIGLAFLSALFYSLSDLIAKLTLDRTNPLALVLWTNILWAPVAAIMLQRREFRQYRVQRLDILLYILRGMLVIAAVTALYKAFELSDSVTLPNVIYGARGFFALAVGYGLGRMLKVPVEQQGGRIYLLRIAGTILLFLALLLVAL